MESDPTGRRTSHSRVETRGSRESKYCAGAVSCCLRVQAELRTAAVCAVNNYSRCFWASGLVGPVPAAADVQRTIPEGSAEHRVWTPDQRSDGSTDPDLGAKTTITAKCDQRYLGKLRHFLEILVILI